MGRAIAARIEEQSLTKAEVQRASAISDKTLNGYIAGKPIVRLDKRRGLCAALGWTTDSIDRILRGTDPLPAAAAPVATGRTASGGHGEGGVWHGVGFEEALQRHDPEAYAVYLRHKELALRTNELAVEAGQLALERALELEEFAQAASGGTPVEQGPEERRPRPEPEQ